MDYTKLIRSARTGEVSRRDFNLVLASLGLTMTAIPMVASPARADAGGDPVVLEWSGYEVPDLYPSYVKKYASKPQFTFFASEDEALEKIRSGFSCDITHPCNDITREYLDAGIALPIDTSRLSNWPDVFPFLKDYEGVQLEGEVYMLPTDWGNSSILYRTDLVDITPEEESWGMLFDEKYKGRLAGYNDWGDVLVAALVAGYTPDEIWTLEDAALAKVRPLLEKQFAITRFFWDDVSQAEQALASGEVVAAYTWNSSVKALRDQGLPVRYARPKEGILTWLCGLTRIKSGKGNEQKVYDFLDAWLSPDAGHYLITAYNYGHSNTKAFDTVSDADLDKLALPRDPQTMFENSIVWRPLQPRFMESYVSLYNDVQANAAA